MKLYEPFTLALFLLLGVHALAYMVQIDYEERCPQQTGVIYEDKEKQIIAPQTILSDR